MKTFHLVVIMIMIFFSLSCTACGQGIERRASVKDAKVEGVVDGQLEDVKSKIVEIFSAKYETRVEHPEDIYTGYRPAAKDRSDGLFPHDVFIKNWVRMDQLPERNDLIEYLTLSEELRKSDIALINFGNRYWSSEYSRNSTHVKYQCNFIVHLESLKTSQTKIQILQYGSKIWVGKKLGMSHVGPAYLNDIRLVEPTMKDSMDLLEFLKDNVK